MIERNKQILSVFRYRYVNHTIIEINVFNTNVHQTTLSDGGTKQEVRHYPTLILRETALLDIRFFQPQSKLR